ncbi:MAG: hypothetical protein K6C08_13645, partial [Oscillospiraceae bacterium]|nr:hypothetical protein [Oscillospiraceae bacterium]
MRKADGNDEFLNANFSFGGEIPTDKTYVTLDDYLLLRSETSAPVTVKNTEYSRILGWYVTDAAGNPDPTDSSLRKTENDIISVDQNGRVTAGEMEGT